MAFSILGTPKPQFFDSSGAPLVNGTVSVLDPADDTNKASYPTYDDAEAATNANANPLTLDSRGEPSSGLWGLDAEDYKIVVKDSDGVTIWTVDDINLPAVTQAGVGSILYPTTSAETTAGVTPSDFSYPAGDVRRYGATGNGTADDTSAFTDMLSFSGRKKVTKPSSKYKIDPIALTVDDIYMFVEPGTIIEANAGFGASDELFDFQAGINNFVIDGYGSIFQMLKADYTTGEQRHVFRIQNSTDIVIKGITAKDSGGDGFYIGLRDSYSERVYIIDCVSDNNRRNGVSVTSGKDIYIVNHISKNTTGTSPEKGYDVEPNPDTTTPTEAAGRLDNVHFINCRSESNDGPGFSYAGGELTQPADYPLSVFFTDCLSSDDGNASFQVEAAPEWEGAIHFTNCHSTNAATNGFEIKGSNVPVIWEGGFVINPNQLVGATERTASAISIYSANGTDGETMGNVQVKGLRVRDPDGNMLKTVALQLVNEATSVIQNVDIEVDADGIAAADRTFESGANTADYVRVVYSDKPEFAATSSIGTSTTPQYAHQKITNEGAAGGVNFSINGSGSQYIGSRYEFEVVASQALGLITDAGNEFQPFNLTSLSSSVPGDKISIEWDGGNWQVTNIVGSWTANSAYTPTNVSTDRAYDADTVAVAELADVVGTLIADLQSKGIIK